jgi:hypothetical protein
MLRNFCAPHTADANTPRRSDNPLKFMPEARIKLEVKDVFYEQLPLDTGQKDS